MTRARRTAPPRQQTLRATVDWSYDLLPKVEQVVLRRRAVFRGDFTMEAASSVVGDEHIRGFEVIDIVANLSHKSLVATDIGSDITYHYMLDTTRTYAIEKLKASGETTAISRRHADYYCSLLAGARNDTATDEFAGCAREIDNIRFGCCCPKLPLSLSEGRPILLRSRGTNSGQISLDNLGPQIRICHERAELD